jgi:hypothetical protein
MAGLPDFPTKETIEAIEHRVPFGRYLTSTFLTVGIVAAICACLKVIWSFVLPLALASTAVAFRPVISTGDVVVIVVALAGLWFFSWQARRRLSRYASQINAMTIEAEGKIALLEAQFAKYQPRTLTEEQRANVVRAISEYDAGGNVIMFCHYADVVDGQSFGQALRTCFLDTTWHVAGGIGVTNEKGFEQGLWVHGGREADRQAVVVAFVSIGLRVQTSGEEDPCVVVTIGRP